MSVTKYPNNLDELLHALDHPKDDFLGIGSAMRARMDIPYSWELSERQKYALGYLLERGFPSTPSNLVTDGIILGNVGSDPWELLDVSNRETITDYLDGLGEVENIEYDPRLIGPARFIIVSASTDKGLEAIAEIVGALADYPVWEDEHYTKLQSAAGICYWCGSAGVLPALWCSVGHGYGHGCSVCDTYTERAQQLDGKSLSVCSECGSGQCEFCDHCPSC